MSVEDVSIDIPKMANTMERKVVTTAASCGLSPNGTATAKDQLPRTNPSRMCTTAMRAPLVSVNIRNFHRRETTSHPGRYVREMLTCHDLCNACQSGGLQRVKW